MLSNSSNQGFLVHLIVLPRKYYIEKENVKKKYILQYLNGIFFKMSILTTFSI